MKKHGRLISEHITPRLEIGGRWNGGTCFWETGIEGPQFRDGDSGVARRGVYIIVQQNPK